MSRAATTIVTFSRGPWLAFCCAAGDQRQNDAEDQDDPAATTVVLVLHLHRAAQPPANEWWARGLDVTVAPPR